MWWTSRGNSNPIQALEVIATELLLADLEQAQRVRVKVCRLGAFRSKRGQRDCGRRSDAAIEGPLIKESPPGARISRSAVQQNYQFLSGKPILYVANVGENELAGNPLSQQACGVREEGRSGNGGLSAKIEAEIAQLARSRASRNFFTPWA